MTRALSKPRGVLILKRVTGMYSRKDPLFTLHQSLHKTPFQHFSVPQGSSFNKKSQNFPIFCSKCLNLVNPVLEASFGSKLSSENSIFSYLLSKISVQQAPKFGADPFYKPLLWNICCPSLPFWNASTPRIKTCFSSWERCNFTKTKWVSELHMSWSYHPLNS